MSVVLQFKLTQTGQTAVWNANNTGLSLNLTHIQFGSGNRTPSGTETTLLNPQQATAIAAGFSVSPTQIRMSAIFTGNQSYVIREVGVWAGDPAVAGAKLVGYWSQAAGDLAMKSPGVDFIFSHDMTLDAAVPAGSLTILADNAQSAMLSMITAHEAKVDPHPQYTTDAEVNALIEARVGDYITSTNVGNAYTVALDPVVTAYTAKTAFAFKASAANTGATTLNAGGGAKVLVREDGTAMQSGDIASGAVVTVVFDTATDSFRSTEIVASQIAATIQAQTYTAFAAGGAAPSFTLTPTPAIAAYAAGQRFRVKFGAAGTGADTLNINARGAKNLKQYEVTGAKVAAVIAANQLTDVEYDGTDFVLLDPLPSLSMITAHEAKVDPHPQYTTDAEVNALIAARVDDALALKAPLNSPALTGTPTTTTPGLFDNTQKVATTAFVTNNGVRYQNPVGYTANQNLTNSACGGLAVAYGASGISMTLPALSAVPAGGVYTFANQASLALTVYANGSEKLQYGAANQTGSMIVLTGESLIVVSTGTYWLFIGGNSNLQNCGSFASSVGASGWERLPTGVIRQWGLTGVIAAGAEVTITLTTSFNTPHTCQLTYVDTGGSAPSGGSPFMFRGFPTNGQIKVKNGGSAAAQYFYEARGI